MADFREIIGKKILIMDGAMGTLIMDAGVRPEDNFDLQNIKQPDLIISIHNKYVSAGADIIETNTFGANRIKLKDYNAENQVAEINKKAVELAKTAAKQTVFVCGSIGPLGKFLKPLGEVSFDEAADAFAEQAAALQDAGADCVSIETISDLQEMRAAVIGIKSRITIPIISSLTFDENELTIFGTSPEIAVTVLEGIGVDVISANCSTGPEAMQGVLKKLLDASVKPIMVMPNAGMPVIENDLAVYKMTPDTFAGFAEKFYHSGASIIGGCCGTSPEHIKAVRDKIPRFTQVKKTALPIKTQKTRFASRSKLIELTESKLLVVGERINPTGRKLLREDIKSGSFAMIQEEASNQSKYSPDLLDININVPEGDDKSNMEMAVHIVEKTTDIPLSIDSSTPEAIEAGLKEFCGKALLNSVNGKVSSLAKILPLAKKYGAAIIGLVLDDAGIPKTAEERINIAEKIIKEAEMIGIGREDIFIDNLVMTAGVGLADSMEALRAIPMVKEVFGVKTILGISNISHGLPNRSKINAVFLELAILYGLDAAIVDPTNKDIIKVLENIKSIRKKNKNEVLISLEAEVAKSRTFGPEIIEEYKLKEIKFSSLDEIKDAVISGFAKKTGILTTQALEKVNPQEIIDKALVPGMEIVGERFSKKIYFLPQVLSSAEAMTAGFELCKERIPIDQRKTSGKILVATVYGDIHDIGKNIVKMMLENHGFEVIDLGKDVPADKIIEAVKQHKPNAIALSALLTTTMLEMKTIKQELKAVGLDVPIIIGGAVVTPEYANKIEASYGSDAAQAVKLAKQIIEQTA